MKQRLLCSSIIVMAAMFSAGVSHADTVTIPLHLLTGKDAGKEIGSVVAKDTKDGLLLTPQLHDLSAGQHGFHIHEKASCEIAGAAAGGHLDPQHTEKHLGPYSTQGHLGDLPVLIVNSDGAAVVPVIAPRLKVSDIINHSLIIHAGGDNYSDEPQKLGGGGERIACGVIK